MERLGKCYHLARWDNELLVTERLPIVFHEFPDGVQSTLDELTVVGNAPPIHHAGVQRFRIRQDDVLGAICREKMARPVRIRMSSSGNSVSLPASIFWASF